MYHVELRQFPHNMCRFNLTDAELRAIVEPWAREKAVDFGERKWSSQTARITILDGPQIPLEQLTMGRGWRAAQRHSKDVTERMLAVARASVDAGPPAVPASGAQGERSTQGSLPDDTPEREVLTLLGDDPAVLLATWRLASERRSELAPSESLALAEATLRSLDQGQPRGDAS